MRGSSFTNLSITESIAKDRDYKIHKRMMGNVKPEIMKDKQVEQQTKIMNDYDIKNDLRKQYFEARLN